MFYSTFIVHDWVIHVNNSELGKLGICDIDLKLEFLLCYRYAAELRVASCELRVASCELRVASCELRVFELLVSRAELVG